MTVKYQTLESAMIKGDRFRVCLRSALCSLYGNLESGLTPQGFITHLGQKLKVLLLSRGVWWPSTLSGLKKPLFLLKAPIADRVRGTGDGTLWREKANAVSCIQQLLAVFSMEGVLPGREGNPHPLDFTDMQQLVCQQSLISLIEL